MSYAGSLTIETSVGSWVCSHPSPKLTLTGPLPLAWLSDILSSSLRLVSSAASAPLTSSILQSWASEACLPWVSCLFIQTSSQLSLTLESMNKTVLAENMTQEGQGQFL